MKMNSSSGVVRSNAPYGWKPSSQDAHLHWKTATSTPRVASRAKMLRPSRLGRHDERPGLLDLLDRLLEDGPLGARQIRRSCPEATRDLRIARWRDARSMVRPSDAQDLPGTRFCSLDVTKLRWRYRSGTNLIHLIIASPSAMPVAVS